MTILKSAEEIALMREAGRIVAEVLMRLKEEVKPGIKTRLLDTIAADELKKKGAKASFKGYRGYPATLCVSINDEVVHGIPGDRILEEGDIVSLDFGAYVKGFHGDSAITVGVGKISDKARDLLETTEAALIAGITEAHAGLRMGDVSSVIQNVAERKGFGVVREYCGHGIGRNLHEDPQVPNFGISGMGIRLQKGMTIAIEPMITTGDWQTRIDRNKWTVHTADNSLAAHFEHTVAIWDNEAEILTRV
jgi:methionyl aminopeptidase